MSKVLVELTVTPKLTPLPAGVTATEQEDGRVLFECVSFAPTNGVLKISGSESIDFQVANVSFPLDKVVQFVTVEV